MLYVIQVCYQQTCMTYTCCCVYSDKTPDDGQRICPNM